MTELTAPFVMKNDEKRIVYGPVLVPNEPDSDGDVVTAEKIEDIAHKFVEDYGNIDLQHSLNNVGKMIESYVTPYDIDLEGGISVPKGSWMLGVRVTDDDTWESVKDGNLTGFSIMAVPQMASKSKEDSTEKDSAQKRTTLADLENQGGYIVNAVSLVDEPAVPKAKWIAIKSKAKKQEQDNITEETVEKAIQGSLEHRERLVRRQVYATFDSETTDSMVHSTLEDSVVIRVEDFYRGHSRMLQIGYEIDDQGNVYFTSEPQEVRIEEQLVPVEQSNPVMLSNDDSEDMKSSTKSEDGFMDKIKRALGFGHTEKAGRTISDTNLDKLRTAKEVIDDIISIGEKERSNKSKESEDDMNKEEVQEMINQSVNPINDKLDDVIKSIKAEGSNEEHETNSEEEHQEQTTQKSQDQSTETEEETTEEGSQSDEVKISKSEYDELLQQAEKAKQHQPFSRRLAGQDGSAEKSEDKIENDRNPFGYKK